MHAKSKMEQQQQQQQHSSNTITTTANHGGGGGDAESRKKRDSRAVKGTTRRSAGDGADHQDAYSSSGEDEPPEQSKKLRATAEKAETIASPSSSVQQLLSVLPTDQDTKPASPSIIRPRGEQKDAAARNALLKPESPRNIKSCIAGNTTNTTPQRATATAPPMDLEIALQRVVRMNTNNKPNNASDEEEQVASRECLSQDCWVNFRIGHAGDASALATCYQKSREQTDKSDKTTEEPSTSSSSAVEDTSLEVRLADGLGDEDTPPVIFALIADVLFQSDEKQAAFEKSILGAAALLSIIWEDSRVLNVEWLYVCKDHDKLNAQVGSLLERRMWLRLSALGLMTSCTLLVAPNTNKKTTEAMKSDRKTETSKSADDQQRSDTSSDRL